MKGNFDNTIILTKLILRRERINSTLWILITSVFMAFIMIIFAGAMDDASRMEMASIIENPALIAMIGPVYGLDNYTMGAMYTNMMIIFTALAIIVMNILFVVRHTRADEERGRYEVVRSLPTGRLANLHAAMIAAVIVNLLLALFVGLGLFITGDESMSFNGSMLFGVLLGAVGLVFAAVAALFAQLSSSSRGATGYSFLAMGVFYFMRAIGDVSAEAEVLSLISPIGLISRSQTFVENYWWPVPILLVTALALTFIAYRFNVARDIDQGLLPDKQGRANGGKLLRTPFGMALKLSKVSLIVGIVTIFMIGASYGSIMGDIDGFIATNEMYQQLMLMAEDYPMLMSFLGMINFMASLMALIPMLIYILKARGEEKEHRAELVISTPVSRSKYLGGYTIIAFASSIILQLATTLGLWLSGTAILDNPADMPLGDLLIANLAYLPALWIMIGLAVFLIGFAPKFTGLVWAAYGFCFFVAFIGRTPAFPEWFPKMTPYGYIAQYPMEELNFLSLAVLTAIAACLTVGGFIFYRKRDMQA